MMSEGADKRYSVAVVTGAAQGIGAAIVHRLAERGYRLALLDRNPDALQSLQQQLRSNGVECLSVSLDVRSKQEIALAVDSILQQWGQIDALINNAGIIKDGLIQQLSEDDWDQVLDVNLKGAFLMCQAVFAAMKSRQAGKIVNIVSRAWLGNIGQANYSASKGGLVSLTRTLALEFARHQINVNAVAPGLIDTPMTQKMPEHARERLLRMQPTGKMGRVEDIAAAVAFLISEDAQFITGQVLHVDGGKSCGLLSL